MIIIKIVLIFFLSLLLSWRGTPMAREAALRFGIVDRPDGRLKTQREPVPYLGGLSIFISFLVSLAMVFEFERQVLGLLLGGSLVVLLGLVDDFGVLTPAVKFSGQFLAASCLVKSGVQMHLSFLPETMNIVLTVIWLIGITNAFNIIDIMDGLSAGVALVASIFLLAVSVINEHQSIAIITAALAGSLCGFIRYNYHPAKIYMGDTGSLFIGLMLGSLSITGQYTLNHRFAFITPLFLLGVPIFDTLFVMIMRARHRRSMFLGSRDHAALRLRKVGLSTSETVNLFYVAAVLLGVLAFLNIFGNERMSIVIGGGVLLAAIASGIALARIDVEST
ncbi:MAG: undecaprenyl/decaprenyl-phosphate alpha-N-acetylglucosaminyl 1-phosphate transferase [Acidobacteria bacterium]|nr:undecaprenyl/decaprenyl-phosphate alpha-N-acetylglucosaminyl 1-phosphate transferase [Acidobacteriota bacterium]